MTIGTVGSIMAHWLRQLSTRLQQTLLAFRADRAEILSAALVYYGVLSVVPLLVMVAAVPGLLLRFSDAPRALAADILQLADAAFGPEFRALLERSLVDLQRDSLVASLVALGVLLFGASLIFRHISRCFRIIWQGVDDTATLGAALRSSMLAKLMDRVVGFLMVLGLSAALVISTIVGMIIPLLQRVFWFAPLISDLAVWAVGPVTSLGVSMLFFLMTFKYLPPVSMRWQHVWPGALLCALGWELAKRGLLIYILVVGGSSSYGAMSVLIAVLFWFYANAMILFFCAELCKVMSRGQ